METKTSRNKNGQRHGLETQIYNGVLFKKMHFRNDVEFGQQWRNDQLIEAKFLELVAGGHWKEDREKYPHSKFYFVGKKILFEFEKQDGKNGRLWCRWSEFWSIFSTDFRMEWLEISQFMTGMVEKHFKLRADTAVQDFQRQANEAEKHFKLRADTAYTWVWNFGDGGGEAFQIESGHSIHVATDYRYKDGEVFRIESGHSKEN